MSKKRKKERDWKLSDYLQVHGFVDAQYGYSLAGRYGFHTTTVGCMAAREILQVCPPLDWTDDCVPAVVRNLKKAPRNSARRFFLLQEAPII